MTKCKSPLQTGTFEQIQDIFIYEALAPHVKLFSPLLIKNICTAAIAKLLPNSMCRTFGNALLHILVITNGSLSYYCLSISFSQPAHSPLTSGINKTFSSRELLLTRYFLFFFLRPFPLNARDGYAWQSQHINSFWSTRTSASFKVI